MGKKKWGGRREGAGRPSKYSTPMQQKTIRLPGHWIKALIDEFGSFQAAIETLVKNHRGES